MNSDSGKIIYVVSFPKSGATWFRLLITALYNQKLDHSLDAHYFYPEIHTQQDLIQERLDKGELVFVKSHFSFEQKHLFENHIQAVILLTRNPIDSMMSMLNHYKLEGVNWVNHEAGLKKFINDFIDSGFEKPGPVKHKLHGGWCHFHNSWLDSKKSYPFIQIKYENLIKNSYRQLTNLNEALHLGFSEMELKKATWLCDFDRIQRIEQKELNNKTPGLFYNEQRRSSFLEKKVQFVSLGKSRKGIEKLNKSLLLRISEVYGETMKKCGYDNILNEIHHKVSTTEDS